MDSSIRPYELSGVLDTAPASVRTLSLDCFDTLVWRNGNAPRDVFADLDFPGGAIAPRGFAGSETRKAAYLCQGRAEVTLPEIYATLMPGADEAACERAIAAELAAEARHCFIFPPARDLIVEARRRGMRVVVVSDTYMSEPQLRGLIAAVGGEELAGMIDRIFCSCEYARCKAEGLFTRILPELGDPDMILHVGDNLLADAKAPAALDIHTAHIRHFDKSTAQRLRLETVAATLLHPATRNTVPASQPHRPAIAMRSQTDADYVLGHDVIGPIMHGYAEWLHGEALALEKAEGKAPKILFLLRDGYLPHQVFAPLFPALAHHCVPVELSRFTATAISFTSPRAVQDYLRLAGDGALPMLAKQLLFTPEETRVLLRHDHKGFLRAVLQAQNMRKIVRRSGRFANRVRTYLRSLGIEQGDTVIFADLDYEGSVQNRAEPRLREEMGLRIAGRYLLLREQLFSGLDKRGYFDVTHYDWRALHSLTESIAIVEQMVTVGQGSVIDYQEDGSPVRNHHISTGGQGAMRENVQQACLDYVARMAGRDAPVASSDTPEARREATAGVLGRLLFLPMEEEVELLRNFYHDVNPGTNAMAGLPDLDEARSGLRRRGHYYAKNANRMYLPGELQPHGPPINLSVFGARRFGLHLRRTDFDVGAMVLPTFVHKDGALSSVEMEAYPTADGYYQALIPVGRAEYAIGLRLGMLFEWLQLEEVCFLHVDNFMEPGAREQTIPAAIVHDGMEEVIPGLFRSLSEEGVVLVPPPTGKHETPLVLSLVFRPIAKQGGVEMRKAA